MLSPLPSFKRVLLGKPFTSDRLARERLPKHIAFPAVAADTLSSLAYAPDSIVLALTVAGAVSFAISPWVGLAVVWVLIVTVVTHSFIIREFPGGGGDFTVAQKYLGPRAGRAVGAALCVDYVLTVAVSASQAATYLGGATSVLRGYEAVVACVIIAILGVVSLRGTQASARFTALPVYLFMAFLGITLSAGAIQALLGSLGESPLADASTASVDTAHATTLLGGILLIVRALTSGCAAVTGVKAFTNAVPHFKRPQGVNARFTLAVAGIVMAVAMVSVMMLAAATKATVVVDERSSGIGSALSLSKVSADHVPVLGQIAQAVFGEHSIMFYLLMVVTAFVLCVAANSAFSGFPVLASVLARNTHLPRFFAARGDRLAYSNGVVTLAILSLVVVIVSGASVHDLINMYVVGVFISYALGQLGLIRHFGTLQRVSIKPAERQLLRHKRLAMIVGFATTAFVILGVCVTKFADGAWLTLALVALLWLVMTSVANHYRRIMRETTLDGVDLSKERMHALCVPSFGSASTSLSHAVVLVTQFDRPSVRSVLVAARHSHTSVQAVSVKIDDSASEKLVKKWRNSGISVPLRIVYSPYRELLGPFLDYVRSLTRIHPSDAIVVYIPEYLVGHWWEGFLHNHIVRRTRKRLASLDRVEVRAVVWNAELARSKSAKNVGTNIARG